jgi:hypothetical protein
MCAISLSRRQLGAATGALVEPVEAPSRQDAGDPVQGVLQGSRVGGRERFADGEQLHGLRARPAPCLGRSRSLLRPPDGFTSRPMLVSARTPSAIATNERRYKLSPRPIGPLVVALVEEHGTAARLAELPPSVTAVTSPEGSTVT